MVIMDEKTYENHRENDWNVMAYTSSAKGFLVKKIRGLKPDALTSPAFENKTNENLVACLHRLKQEGYAPDEVSLA